MSYAAFHWRLNSDAYYYEVIDLLHGAYVSFIWRPKYNFEILNMMHVLHVLNFYMLQLM